MVLIEDNIYYTKWDGGNGWLFKLQIIIGRNTDLPSPVFECELPDGLIYGGIEAEVGFVDDIPKGLTEKTQVKLKLDLTALYDRPIPPGVGYLDWSTFKEWILRRFHPTPRTVNGVDLYIPNRFILLSNGGSGSIYNVVEWDCLQDKRPSWKRRTDRYGSQDIELTLSGTTEIALEAVTFNIYKLNSVSESNKNDVYEMSFTDGLYYN